MSKNIKAEEINKKYGINKNNVVTRKFVCESVESFILMAANMVFEKGYLIIHDESLKFKMLFDGNEDEGMVDVYTVNLENNELTLLETKDEIIEVLYKNLDAILSEGKIIGKFVTIGKVLEEAHDFVLGKQTIFDDFEEDEEEFLDDEFNELSDIVEQLANAIKNIEEEESSMDIDESELSSSIDTFAQQTSKSNFKVPGLDLDTELSKDQYKTIVSVTDTEGNKKEIESTLEKDFKISSLIKELELITMLYKNVDGTTHTLKKVLTHDNNLVLWENANA